MLIIPSVDLWIINPRSQLANKILTRDRDYGT